MNAPAQWHIAVDFGTSNSAAAHTAPMTGAVETLPLSHRSNLIPSAVFVQADGAIHCGDSAISLGRRDPSRLVPAPKRYIGHDQVQVAGQDVPLNALIGAVLYGVLERGRAQHSGENPTTVTLTHPESWSVHNVDMLLSAAATVGLSKDTIRTISEPRAAAIHYAAQQHIPAGSHVAVFDFGGGTLDIAVLRAEQNGDFSVVAAKGDNTLGGRTIDNVLYRWVLDQVEHNDPDTADELKSAEVSVMHSLDQSIREAKEMLSDTSSATITVSTPRGEHDFLITRDEFNTLIDKVVGRAVELTQAALSQAGVDKSTPIYMTGGSSRIPYVQNRLGEVGTVMTLDDPKTVVARGALAATMMGFTEGSGQVTATKSQQPNNPFGVGPGTVGAAQAASQSQGQPQQGEAQGTPGTGQRPGQRRASSHRATSSPLSNISNRKKAVFGAVAVVVLLLGFMTYQFFWGTTMVTKVNTTAADSMIPLTERYDTASQFLPEKTLQAMQDCEGKANEYSDDLTVNTVYDCSLLTSAMSDAPKVGSSTPSTIYWIPGDDAKQARDELESGKANKSSKTTSKERLQKSFRNTPEVGYALTETGSGFVYAYYPRQKFTLYFKTSYEATPDQVKELTKYLGWTS
jgi:hypothetical protein